MRYLLVLSWIGLLLSTFTLFEQGRRYILSDHGLDVATTLKSQAADPMEGRIPEFVEDEKVANLIRTVLQSNGEQKAVLAESLVEIHSSLKDRALFDGAMWAVQVVILAIVLSRLNESRRDRRPLDDWAAQVGYVPPRARRTRLTVEQTLRDPVFLAIADACGNIELPQVPS